MKKNKHALYIFRSDLRLKDNRALKAAVKQSEKVSCLFVVDPCFEQNKRYFAKAMLLDILSELDKALGSLGAGLHVAFATPIQAIAAYEKNSAIDAVFVNKVYTDSGRARDDAIASFCAEKNIGFKAFDDQLLFPPGMVVKADGEPYSVFTPFYKRALQYSVESVITMAKLGVLVAASKEQRYNREKLQRYWLATAKNESAGLEHYTIKALLDQFYDEVDGLKNYTEQRDFPALNATSKLSSLLRFGVISVRSAYHYLRESLGVDAAILRQLYWRDFFHHIAWHFPHSSHGAFKQQYAAIVWSNNLLHLTQWKKGLTGFPIVDAGMRELKATGFMHNRVRMIVASFLVKDLHLNWRLGEAHFKDYLLDYDRAVNNGNWQWAASTGCDAQPYFRIFNPWRQQQRFDPDCEYILRWLPELKGLDCKTIHGWAESTLTLTDYPKPIVDHKIQAETAKALFKACAKYTV